MGIVAALRSSELAEGSKVYKELEDRSVLFIRKHGVVYCLDAYCHHQGLPLSEGQVVDVEDTPAVVCPWHGRKIDLSTGCLLSFPACTGQQQRTHAVREAGGCIWVSISTEREQSVNSDNYNTAKSCKSPAPFVGFGLAGRPDFSRPAEVSPPSSSMTAALQNSPSPIQDQIRFPQRRFGLSRAATARQAVMNNARRPPMVPTYPTTAAALTADSQKSLFDTQLFNGNSRSMHAGYNV